MKKGSKHTERTKTKIRIEAIKDRLQKFALGEKDGRSKKPIEMSAQQLRAAQLILDRHEPVLQRVTWQGDAEKPIYHRVERVIVKSTNRDR